MNPIETPSTDEVLILKKELAIKYVKEIKKDLNLLQQGVFIFVEGKVKKVLLQTEPLGESVQELELNKFEKFLIDKLPQSTVERIYKIIKEKQQLLIKAQTKQDLEALKTGVAITNTTPDTPVNTDTPQEESKPAPITPQNTSTPTGEEENAKVVDKHTMMEGKEGGNGYVSTGIIATGLTGEIAQSKIRNRMVEARAEKLEKVLTEGEMKKGLQELTKSLEYKMKDTQLLKSQQKQLKNMLQICKDAENSTSAMKELALRKDLVKKNVLSANLFELCKVDAAGMKILADISKDQKLIEEIAKIQDTKQIQSLLNTKGFTGLSDDVIKVLAEAKTVEGVSGTVNVLAKGSELTKLAKLTKGIPIFDLAYIGMETYNRANNDFSKMRNADRKSNKQREAGVTHSISILSVGVPMAMSLLATGPYGWVTLGVLAAGEGVNQVLKTCYFDVKDFYLQDKMDLIVQERTEIKQAIIQSFAGSTRNNLSVNEKICGWMGGVNKSRKIQTVEDGVRANLYLEESPAYGFVASVDRDNKYNLLTSDEKNIYDTQKLELDAKIDARLQYIKQFLPPAGEHILQFSNAIKQGTGFSFLEKLMSESAVSARLKQDPSINVTGLDDYMKQRGDQLKSENEKVFIALEKIGKENPLQLSEFLQRNEYFSGLVGSADIQETNEVQQEVAGVKDICLFVKKYAEWKNIRTPFEQKNRFISIIDRDDVDTKMCLEKLQTTGEFTMGAHLLSHEEVKTRLMGNMDQGRFTEDFPYSEDMRQNIIYRIAKEFHGYEGPNNSTNLKEYFSETKDSKHGLYYKTGNSLASMGGWTLNVDRAVDNIKLDFFDIEKSSVDSVLAKWFGGVSLGKDKDGKDVFINPSSGEGMYMRGHRVIDSATETTDGVVNQEFINKIRTILTEEKEASNDQNKKKTTEDIIKYLNEHANGGYCKLPYYLVSQAARAGLGQLQYRYFTLDSNSNISAVTTNEFIGTSLHIPNIQKSYISQLPGVSSPTDQQISDAKIVGLTGVDKKTTEVVDALTDRIQKTCGRLDRKTKRGDVLYDPVTKEVVSWGKRTKLEQKDNKWIVAEGKYKVSYESLEEAALVAHLFNWFSADFKKNNPNLSLSYYDTGFFGNMFRGRGVFNENGIDTKVFTRSFISDSLKETFDSRANYGEFFRYIENTLV